MSSRSVRRGFFRRGVQTQPYCLDDFRKLAAARVPRIVSDFIEGGADGEFTAERNRQAFARPQFAPRTISHGEVPSLATELFGVTYSVPFGVAPMGLPDFVWPGTAMALAGVAAAENLPFILSTAASISIERAAAIAGGNLWFQLYAGSDPDLTIDLMRRAHECGVEALVLTFDSPRASRRLRDLRNDLRLEFKPTLWDCIDFLRHPAWLAAVMRSGAPRVANFDLYREQGLGGKPCPNPGFAIAAPAIDRAKLAFVRKHWHGVLIAKGVQRADEARELESAGYDGLILSNHGGRQLDQVSATVDLIAELRAALKPSTKLMIDGGVRRGSDIVKAMALGADFVFLGRPWLSASAAVGPEDGPAKLVEILREELETVLVRLGCRTIPVGDVEVLRPASW